MYYNVIIWINELFAFKLAGVEDDLHDFWVTKDYFKLLKRTHQHSSLKNIVFAIHEELRTYAYQPNP